MGRRIDRDDLTAPGHGDVHSTRTALEHTVHVVDLCDMSKGGSGGPVFGSITLGEDPAQWTALADIWNASDDRSPFQAPGILRYFSAHTTEVKRLFTLRRAVEMRAAVVFKQDAARNLSFLSDLKTDVNRFLFRSGVGEEERRSFFQHLLGVLRDEDLSLTLNNQPGDDGNVHLLAQCAEEAGMFSAVVPHSACPVVEAASPEDLFAHVNGLRELRYRVNKLRDREGAQFEVFTDNTGIDDWTDEFCDVHVRRWQGTPTPSNLRHPHRRAFLKGCLHAWAGDGLLVRFSVCVDGKRIGFVVGLRAPETIVHHSTTYDPAFAKSSPGKALILHMAGWMRDNGCRILDFGDGREDYKYTVATGERPLARVFIARKDNLRFIASSSVIRVVRGNRFLYDVYQRHIKRRLRAS